MSRRLQQQARALGDPTRFAIFQHVSAAGAPVRVAALTVHFGLNHNAVRQHLAKLCDAKLLVEEVAGRTGPGRPALQYRPAPGVPGTWGARSPYEELAMLLLSVLVDGQRPVEVGRVAGAEAALVSGDGPLVGRLCGEMQRRGFEPRVADDGDVVLDLCPFVTAASAQPDIICELHRGLVEGFVEAEGQSVELSVRAATDGGCRISLTSRASA